MEDVKLIPYKVLEILHRHLSPFLSYREYPGAGADSAPPPSHQRNRMQVIICPSYKSPTVKFSRNSFFDFTRQYLKNYYHYWQEMFARSFHVQLWTKWCVVTVSWSDIYDIHHPGLEVNVILTEKNFLRKNCMDDRDWCRKWPRSTWSRYV